MLRSLYIRNLALVDELTIDFSPGLSVISGETGAGKSLLLNALGLALGDRYNPTLLANGSSSGQVVASFEIALDHPACDWLKEQNIDANECFLRRSFTTSGSKCFINGTPVTQNQMGAIGDILIELHGQHQHHSLLNKTTQQQLFDDYSQLTALANTVAQLYQKKRKLEKKLQDLQTNLQDTDATKQYLIYQLQELEKLSPQEGEYENLSEQQKIHSLSQDRADFLRRAMDFTNGSSQIPGALEKISQLNQTLKAIPFVDYNNIRIIFEQIEIQLSEAVQILQELQSQSQPNDEEIHKIEYRLGQWHDLARKHRIDPKNLQQLFDKFQKKITEYEQRDQQVLHYKQQLEIVNSEYLQACEKLSAGRQKRQLEFADSVTQIMNGLAMSDACFAVNLKLLQQPGAQGNEQVHFQVQTNQGSKMTDIQNIASGGELSRISLAIHQTCNQVLQYNRCMVFDEIDSGISGTVAERVGKLLRILGKRYQVVCITHQPQVVAHSHSHLLAKKTSQRGITSTDLQLLNTNCTIAEIARMIGSEGTKEKSLELARQMYQLGQS